VLRRVVGDDPIADRGPQSRDCGRSCSGTGRCLAQVQPIADSPALASYRLLPAVQAELWTEAGDAGRAAEYYRGALDLVAVVPERRFLAARLASSTRDGGTSGD
jgi:predicted RNA polymerase sigma factor